VNFSELKIKVLGPTLKPRRPGLDLIDGDGDGLCEESEGLGVPCPPKLLRERIQQMWDQRHAQRLERRRGNLKRAQRRRDPWGKRTPLSVDAMRRAAQAGQYSVIEAEMKRLFEIEDLGGIEGVRSVVDEVYGLGDLPDSPDPDFPNDYGIAVQVNGRILDDEDNQIGEFKRIILPEKKAMYHDYFEMDAENKGNGVGSDFITTTEGRYHRMGFEEVMVQAALKDGPYTWAVAGFDWADALERRKFLGYMLDNIADYRSGERPELFESQQEALELEALVLRALEEDFNDPNRLTPYIFTLFKGAREGLTKRSYRAVDVRTWNGTRKVTPPPTVSVKQLLAQTHHILNVHITQPR